MYRKLICIISAFVSLTANAAVISTEKDINSDNLKHIFGSQQSMQKLYEVGSYYESVLERNKGCESKVNIIPVAIGIVKPIAYDKSKTYPDSGMWSTRFKLIRCENTSIYNALFMAEPDKAPKAIALYPGESLTDPQLFMDTVQKAVLLLKASEEKLLSSCDKKDNIFYISNTKVSSPVKDGRWAEEWEFKVCTQHKSVLVEFTPDEKGTKFLVKPLAK